MRTWRRKTGALWNWDAGVGEGRWVDWVMRIMSAMGRILRMVNCAEPKFNEICTIIDCEWARVWDKDMQLPYMYRGANGRAMRTNSLWRQR